MADFKPIKLNLSNELTRFQTGDTVGVEHGGTGSSTAAGARSALGLAIGTDIQGHSDMLDTLSSVTGTGFISYDGAGGWNVRSIATASASRITVSIANGSTGNPVLDLATVTNSGTGAFLKITSDTYGRVTGTTSVSATDITGLVDSVYLRLNGASAMTSHLTLFGDPIAPLHAVTKQYVDTVMAAGGTPPYAPARVRTTGNITLSGIQTIDGVALVAGDRVLVASQTDEKKNGIYIVAAGAWARSIDADQPAEFTPARQVFIQSGTLYGFTTWAVSNSTAPVIGNDPVSFVQVGGAAQYSAGNGLNLSGTQFSVKPVSGQIVSTSSGVGLATSGVTAGTYTKITVDAYGRATVGAAATASDVGAQPANAALTALAGVSANGFVTRTAANTFAARSLATVSTARITVTNGDGVSGNPTVDLATTGVTAGTYNSLTVDAYGRVVSGTTKDSDQIVSVVTNGHTSSIAIGRAVYISGIDSCKPANANNPETSQVFGIVSSISAASGAATSVVIKGLVTATTLQWDAVTAQSGGLTPGARYYLSNTTAGSITTTAPTTGVLAPVGIAISTTKMSLDIERIIVL